MEVSKPILPHTHTHLEQYLFAQQIILIDIVSLFVRKNEKLEVMLYTHVQRYTRLYAHAIRIMVSKLSVVAMQLKKKSRIIGQNKQIHSMFHGHFY